MSHEVEGFVRGLFHVIKCDVMKSGRYQRFGGTPLPLKGEAAGFSEILVLFYKVTRRHVPVYSNLQYVSRTAYACAYIYQAEHRLADRKSHGSVTETAFTLRSCTPAEPLLQIPSSGMAVHTTTGCFEIYYSTAVMNQPRNHNY
jgi:hypothetical protein